MSAPTPPSAERIAELHPSLLPCPFCGAPEVGIRYLAPNQGAPAIFAAYCARCEVQTQWAHSRDEAADSWNRRESHARLVEAERLLRRDHEMYGRPHADEWNCRAGLEDATRLYNDRAAFLSPATATEETR